MIVPMSLVIFYRALVAGPILRAIMRFARRSSAGLNPVGLCVTSLKDERSVSCVCAAALAAYPPDIIINATAFATATA